MPQKEGWILDVYPVSNGMCVWIVDERGQSSSYLDPWCPLFYLNASSSEVKNLEPFFQSFKIHFSLSTVLKKDFFTNEPLTVLEVRVGNPLFYQRVGDRLLRFSSLRLYNADLNLGQMYFYERGLFPLARCSFVVDAEGVIQKWELRDSCWDLDYPLPPLRYAHLGFESTVDPLHASFGSPKRGRRGGYLLTLGQELGVGTSYLLNESVEELLTSLNRYFTDWDPDILLTDWGDSYIMPQLQSFSNISGIPLHFSRDPSKSVATAKSHSFFSYGKVIFRAGPRTLFGRLHLDTKNSFMVHHSKLEGLFEIARVAKIPLQRAARCTIGTSLSSMQHEWAIKNDYLIPIDKGQTEDFRPGDELIASDRGGLVYEPEVGWHEDLIEYDFVSMYPEIMVRHNVTPEAMNCECCPDNKVPEISHHLCRHRRGLVPHVLEPIVKKRYQYKQLVVQGHPNKDVYRCRSEAFKWALVTCFGYLGFRNARFGKIEAHECVNAYSREALLKAKEVAEGEGYHFVHAIVDSFWLKKPGVTGKDIESLRLKIEKAAGLPLGFEGRYRWIRFCSSKTNRLVGVPNRYFGAFQDGTTKVRGIELRRHDTPIFIKRLQEKLIALMAQAKNLSQFAALEQNIEGIVEECRDELRSGGMSPFDLAITLHLSRNPEEYVHDTLSALAAKKLAASGVSLHPGESIQYVVAAEKDKVKDWRVIPLAFIEDAFEYDVAYYERLLDRAIDITPFSSRRSRRGQVSTYNFLAPTWKIVS